jgi:hypothetical protein
MQIKKFLNGKTYAALLGGVVLFSSCTKNYKEINVDKNKIAIIGPAELPFLFSAAEHSAPNTYYDYQVAENLFADQYAQYFACEATYFQSDRLTMRPDWSQAAFNPKYTDVMPQLQSIFAATDSATSAEYAMANILWVWTFHRVTDYWGPIPYFSAGKAIGTSVPYDPQDKIYDDFFKRLAAAVTVLKTHAGENHYGSYDLIYGGDVNRWIKFGNSLRLRLALRISKVDPARAKTEAEAAVASGVMTTSAAISNPSAMTTGDDAFVLRSAANTDGNGLQAMSDWNEFRMSSTMASVLNGYQDPREPSYFLPALNTGLYSGLRNGLSITQLGLTPNLAGNNSHVGQRWSSTAVVDKNGNSIGSATSISTGQNIMVTAESYFNRAEGAILGWNMGGTAQSLYNQGITQSLIQWNVTNTTTQTAYINSANTPVAPGDGMGSAAVSTIPILFNTTNNTIALQQIATQKWLALFPDGIEAWADYRRSHVMKLYPVVNSDNPDLPDPTTQWIRRLTFLASEIQTNGAAVTAAVGLLGSGGDKITTPLWWDKN